MLRPDSVRRWVLLHIFVVSGFTGLIYESIWSHYLKLFLGHAAYAQTLVLAMFMGGMALGSWLVARYASRLRRLLLGYVVVEAIIGVFGLLFHPLFVGASEWSFASVIPALSSNAAVHFFKWTLGALLILPQSVLLGMTFPLISGGIIRRWPDRPGETLSLLYFTNSIGAAIGVLVSGFVLIETSGLAGTIRTAGLLNLLLALSVWWIVRRQDEPVTAPGPAPTATDLSSARWFLWAAFGTGAASFLYEIGWIRMLSLVLGSSTHSFELMLSAFIFGLALGGLWMRRRIERITDPARYLGGLMIVMGGLALLTLPAYNKTFDIMQWALQTFSPTEQGYTAFNLVSQSIALLVMLPTTFCAGMTLPLLTHALLKRTGNEGAIGAVYASNTLGAIAGVLVAVHVLMPLVGVKGVIMGGAALHMGLGLSGLVLLVRIPQPLRLKAAAACFTALAAIGLLTQLDPLRMTSSVYRTGHARAPAGAQVKYLRDGKTATISVIEMDGTVIIGTNGKPDASIQMGPGPIASDETTMIVAAALPLSIHPNPERVANIGFGSGLTAHTVLGADFVKELDSIEIEPLMVEGARLAYYPRVRRVFEDPRSRIVYEDAKTFFATARKPYDIIISEPSNPWVSGVATLFSQEFYARAATYLKPDGYFVQWIQAYETDVTLIASVMKALVSQFPNYAMYSDNSNVLIVATRGGELPEVSDRLFALPALSEELARVGIHSADDLRQRRIGTNKLLDPMFQSFAVPANSDYVPFLDLNAPRARYMRRNAAELLSLLTSPVPLEGILSGGGLASGEVNPTASGQYYRDDYVRRGRMISDVLVHGQTVDLDPAIARDLALVSMSSEQCKDAGAREVWRRAVREISDQTSSFAPTAARTEVWKKIRSSACYAEHAGLHRDWTDFLEAIAARDTQRIEKVGETVLQAAADQLNLEERTFATLAIAAAKLERGSVNEAHALLDPIAQSGDYHQFYELSVRQLLALSNVRPDTSMAAGPHVLVERIR